MIMKISVASKSIENSYYWCTYVNLQWIWLTMHSVVCRGIREFRVWKSRFKISLKSNFQYVLWYLNYVVFYNERIRWILWGRIRIRFDFRGSIWFVLTAGTVFISRIGSGSGSCMHPDCEPYYSAIYFSVQFNKIDVCLCVSMHIFYRL